MPLPLGGRSTALGTRPKVLLKRVAQITIDLVVLTLSIWLAYFIRFDSQPPAWALSQMMVVWAPIVLFKYAVLHAIGISRFSWRYTSLRDVTRVVELAVITTGALLTVRSVGGWVIDGGPQAHPLLVPRGVLGIDFALTLLGLTGVRALRRLLTERRRGWRPAAERRGTPTLLIGAGDGGFLVARQITRRPELRIDPVGFVDDDHYKIGSQVHGIPVRGTTHEVADIARDTGASEALITVSSASGKDIRRITSLCEEAGLHTKIVPGLHEIVGGTVNLSRIRPVDVEDLLRREPVVLDTDAIAETLRGRTVLVTGAGGSIGAELCRQICRFRPASVILVERAESSLFAIHGELLRTCDATGGVRGVVADVCDSVRMRHVFARFRPDAVFHAAAHKQVPILEDNCCEAVRNNVLGTRTVADLADEFACEIFVNVSTDKAVNPTSVMGATKRVAELYVQALERRSDTKFVSVRFGNVLGSTGSVVPVFKEQIARGGPVTVTHPDMVRYFMTIPEASQLVLQASAIGNGGEVLTLDMGEPVRIVDLATDLITLSGFRPHDDIDIVFTGIRPGEKLFEELHLDGEQADRTAHPKIFVGREPTRPYADIVVEIKELFDATDGGDDARVRRLLCSTVPEYVPS